MSRFAFRATLTRFKTRRIYLRSEFVGGHVVLDVHRALRADGFRVGDFRLVVVAHNRNFAVRHLLNAQSQLVEYILAVVIHTPRLLGIFLERALAPILHLGYLLHRWYSDRRSATGAQFAVVRCRTCDG